MIEQLNIEHHIQKHIIGILMHQKYARFRDLRPPKIDTNLYSYHLKLLIKNGYVVKVEQGYTLAEKGLLYVDRVSIQSLTVRTQPKIITMLVIKNTKGEVLLYKRRRQPFADLWTLTYGKIHIEDRSTLQAAQREAQDKLGLPTDLPMEHKGDCYIRIQGGSGEVIMTTLAHVFCLQYDAIAPSDRLVWVHPDNITQYDLAPAVQAITKRALAGGPFYYEEYLITDFSGISHLVSLHDML